MIHQKTKKKKKECCLIYDKSAMAVALKRSNRALERILPLILALSGQGSKLAPTRYLYRNSVIYDSGSPLHELFCPIRMYRISCRNFQTVSRFFLSTTMFCTVIRVDFYFTASSTSITFICG